VAEVNAAARASVRTRLFVDCEPGQTFEYEVTHMAVVVKLANERIASSVDGGPPDYRYVEYGKGPACLVDAALEIVKEKRYDAIVLDTRTPEGQILLNPLLACCDGAYATGR